MAVRKWNVKVKNIKVSNGDTTNDVDAMMKNQGKTTRTRWNFGRCRMADSTKIDRIKGTMIPRLLQHKVCKITSQGKKDGKGGQSTQQNP